MLEVDKLSRPGLAPVSLALDAGECLAVAGPSGGGKTLLLRAIADLDPSEGTVSLDGADRAAMPAPAWRRKVTFVAAEPGWWAERVRDHFAAPTRSASLLERLGLRAGAMDWPVVRASTGERQRLALARALAREPRVLLLDEPTGALDGEATGLVEALLRERMAAGVAVILVTHDRAQARRLARRLLTVDGGVAREEAP